MTVKRNVRKAFRRLLCSRRGTAEIIGSVMFLLIMMFFFTNVFLWHDNATREMDGVLSDKMNSLVSISVKNWNVSQTGNKLILTVTNNGGVDAELSRLWINVVYGGSHTYRSVSDPIVHAGETKVIELSPTSDVTIGVYYLFKIVTTRGNMAACSGTPVGRM
jgi:archaellum component FlaF (FlaF/FlaG flagellin family)